MAAHYSNEPIGGFAKLDAMDWTIPDHTAKDAGLGRKLPRSEYAKIALSLPPDARELACGERLRVGTLRAIARLVDYPVRLTDFVVEYERDTSGEPATMVPVRRFCILWKYAPEEHGYVSHEVDRTLAFTQTESDTFSVFTETIANRLIAKRATKEKQDASIYGRRTV